MSTVFAPSTATVNFLAGNYDLSAVSQTGAPDFSKFLPPSTRTRSPTGREARSDIAWTLLKGIWRHSINVNTNTVIVRYGSCVDFLSTHFGAGKVMIND